MPICPVFSMAISRDCAPPIWDGRSRFSARLAPIIRASLKTGPHRKRIRVFFAVGAGFFTNWKPEVSGQSRRPLIEPVNQLRAFDWVQAQGDGIFRGWLVVDKACRTDLYHRGETSVRWALKRKKKAGHAGRSNPRADRRFRRFALREANQDLPFSLLD